MSVKFPFRLTNQNYMHSADFVLQEQALTESYGLHWHDFFEITYVISGRGYQMLNGQPRNLQPGTVFLLTPADFHAVSPEPGQTLQLYNLTFNEELLADEVRSLIFADNRDYYCVPPAGRRPIIVEALKTIGREQAEKKAGHRLVVKGALEHILIELFRSCKDNRPSRYPVWPAQQPSTISRALLYMHTYFRKPLTLEDAAQQARLTPNYFSECFHKATGISFQSYLQQLRLKSAAALLKTSDLPVTAVCYASGFNTLSHFTRAFKHQFGDSPIHYRHKQQE